MGWIYAELILGVTDPRIGLLNVGAEDDKGSDLTRTTRALFQEGRWRNVRWQRRGARHLRRARPRDRLRRLRGNVLLKAGEGAVEFLSRSSAREFAQLLPGVPDGAGHRIAESLHELKSRFEYEEFGGGPLLGIRGACIICHGSSSSRAIRNALTGRRAMATSQVNSRIVEQLKGKRAAAPSRKGRAQPGETHRRTRSRSRATEVHRPCPKSPSFSPARVRRPWAWARSSTRSFPRRELFDRRGMRSWDSTEKLCFEGPAEALEATDVSQPAIFVASLAALESLKATEPGVVKVRGGGGTEPRRIHGSRVRRRDGFRGRLEVVGGEVRPCRRLRWRRRAGWRACWGLTMRKSMISADGSRPRPALEGEHAGAGERRRFRRALRLKQVEPIATEMGAMKVIPLAVAGAFHTPLMKPADEQLAEALARPRIRPPRTPCFSNVDGCSLFGCRARSAGSWPSRLARSSLGRIDAPHARRWL